MRAAIPKAGALAMTLAMALLAALLFAACMAKDDRDNVPPPPPPPPPGTFTEVALIIADYGCTDCHGSTTTVVCSTCHSSLPPVGVTSADIAVLDHAGMVGVASTAVTGESIVDAGFSDTSVLYWVVSEDKRYTGGMLSYMGTSSISTEDMAIIASWIDDGAPEN